MRNSEILCCDIFGIFDVECARKNHNIGIKRFRKPLSFFMQSVSTELSLNTRSVELNESQTMEDMFKRNNESATYTFPEVQLAIATIDHELRYP